MTPPISNSPTPPPCPVDCDANDEVTIDAGLHPTHVFPPDAAIVERDPLVPLATSSFPADWRFVEGPIGTAEKDAIPELRLEIEMIWNANYQGRASLYGLEPRKEAAAPLVNDALAPPPYEPSSSGVPGAEALAAIAATGVGNPYGAVDNNTSEFLSGKVAVGIFTVESAGAGETVARRRRQVCRQSPHLGSAPIWN